MTLRHAISILVDDRMRRMDEARVIDRFRTNQYVPVSLVEPFATIRRELEFDLSSAPN
ncbi:MAG: hypothetical protein AAF664_23595 [Planctomycetota bacterium]